MKKWLLHLILYTLLTANVQAAPSLNDGVPSIPPEDWTLADAVLYAIDNNPDIHIALQRLDSSTAMVASARSYTMPSLSLVGEYSQTNNPMYSFGNILNQGAFDNSIDFNDPGRTDDLLLQARVEYRLYDGGKIQANVDKAESDIKASANQLDVVHQQLAFEVVQSYHAILQAQEMLEVRDAAVKAISASLAVGKAQFDAGSLLKEDLLNLELQQAREEENRIRTRHQYELNQRIFWNLLGITPHQQVTLPTLVQEQEIPQSLNYSGRKELQTLDAQISSAEAGLKAVRSGEKPAVDTFAHYQFEHGTVLGESGDSWLAGVRLNYSLYNGNRTEAEIAAAKAHLAEIKSQKAKVELALSLELQRAQISYQQSIERLHVTAKMVEVAKESAALSRIRFQEGVILASDLIDMEMRLTDARARRTAARTENRIAIANLRRVTGAEQFTENN